MWSRLNGHWQIKVSGTDGMVYLCHPRTFLHDTVSMHNLILELKLFTY